MKSCVSCIITDEKAGKKEGFLKPIDKDDKPLVTFHIDHVGLMEMTKKSYNHILVVVDGFTKFVWLYPTKSTDTRAVIDSLEKQASIFGNAVRIVTHRGAAFRIRIRYRGVTVRLSECINYWYPCWLNIAMINHSTGIIISAKFK